MSGEGENKRFVLLGSILTELACVGVVLAMGWLLLRMPVWLIAAEGVGLVAIFAVGTFVGIKYVTRYPPRFVMPKPREPAADDENNSDREPRNGGARH